MAHRAPNPHRCTEHPAAEAGWRCEDCGRLLCPDCCASEATGEVEGAVRYEVCSHCDGRAAVLMVGGTQESYGDLLLLSLRVPIGWPTLSVGVALWALTYVGRNVEGAGFAVLWGVLNPALLWALFFLVLQAAARGGDLVGEGRAETELVRDVAWPGARMVVVTWLAFGVGALLVRAGVNTHNPDKDWRLWSLALALGVPLPAWLIALGRGDGLLQALSPRTTFRLARALAGDYTKLVGVSMGLCGLMLFWLGTASYIAQESRLAATDPGTADFSAFALLISILCLYFALFFARLVGLTTTTRADALGIEFRADQRVPALPGIAPRGARKAKPPPVVAPPRPAFVELEEAAHPGPLVLTEFGARDELDDAVARFAALDDSEAIRTLGVVELIELGQRAMALARPAVAVRALKLAASMQPEHPDAPRACVILARLYAERLNEPAAAEKLFRHVATRYPGTKAAQFAQDRLKQTG